MISYNIHHPTMHVWVRHVVLDRCMKPLKDEMRFQQFGVGERLLQIYHGSSLLVMKT